MSIGANNSDIIIYTRVLLLCVQSKVPLPVDPLSRYQGSLVSSIEAQWPSNTSPVL